MFMCMREGNTLLVQSPAVMKDSSVKKASLDLYNERSRSIILCYAKSCPVLLYCIVALRLRHPHRRAVKVASELN